MTKNNRDDDLIKIIIILQSNALFLSYFIFYLDKKNKINKKKHFY